MPTIDEIQKARLDFKRVANRFQAYLRVAEDRLPNLTKAQTQKLRLLVADSTALIKQATELFSTGEVKKTARPAKGDDVRKHGTKPRTQYP